MMPPKPFNSYNIFFILERALLLEQRGTPQQHQQSAAAIPDNHACASSQECRPSPVANAPEAEAPSGYGLIDLPPLPPRYHHLKSKLPSNCYVPGKNKLVKRSHVKTHGLVSFKEIAIIVSRNWKTIDPVTKEYIDNVVALLKNRYAEISSASPSPTPSAEKNEKTRSIAPAAAAVKNKASVVHGKVARRRLSSSDVLVPPPWARYKCIEIPSSSSRSIDARMDQGAEMKFGRPLFPNMCYDKKSSNLYRDHKGVGSLVIARPTTAPEKHNIIAPFVLDTSPHYSRCWSSSALEQKILIADESRLYYGDVCCREVDLSDDEIVNIYLSA